MADVSQPSSLTLEPNPFEQSFASKAQEHSALKGAHAEDDNVVGARSESNRVPGPAEIAGRPIGSLKDNEASIDDPSRKKGRPIPGIDKIMTPMPLMQGAVPQAPGNGFQSYPLNLINVSSPLRWARPGPFTPTIAGTPTYEGYTALPDQMQHLPGSGPRPGEEAGVSTPTSMVPGHHQGPMITAFGGFGNGVRGPVPLDSPGIMMNPPLPPGVMFPSMASQGAFAVPPQAPQHVRTPSLAEAAVLQPGVARMDGDLRGPPRSTALTQESPPQHVVPAQGLQAPPQPPTHVQAQTQGPQAQAHAQPQAAVQPPVQGQVQVQAVQAQPQMPSHAQSAQAPAVNGAPHSMQGSTNNLYLLNQQTQPAPLQDKPQGRPSSDTLQDANPQHSNPQHATPQHAEYDVAFRRNRSGSGSNEVKEHGEGSRAASRLSNSNVYHSSPSHPGTTSRKRSASVSNSDTSDIKEELDSKRSSHPSASTPDLDENERRKVFLERNRIAAIKCRQRKKQWVNDLKSKADIYSQMSEELQRENQKLKSDLEQLRQFIFTYHDVRSIPHNILSIVNFSEQSHDISANGVPASANTYPSQHPHQKPVQPHQLAVNLNGQMPPLDRSHEGAQHM